MKQILEALQHRRVWTAIFGFIALVLPVLGVQLDLDVNGLTDATMRLVEAISGLMVIILPIHSYFKPK
jgi:hypothetical protein